jgi:hypothetical protein
VQGKTVKRQFEHRLGLKKLRTRPAVPQLKVVGLQQQKVPRIHTCGPNVSFGSQIQNWRQNQAKHFDKL